MEFRWLSLFFVLLMVGQNASAGVGAGVYNEANALYRAGRFAEAAERYEAALRQGVRNGYVYYNLGNAYFKAGRIGRAILAYERALKLMPGDGDVRANLRFANAMKVDRDPEADENVVTRFLTGLYGALSADGLALFCSVCLFLMAGAGTAWLFSPGRRTIWIGLIALLGFGLLGSGALTAFKIHDREAVQQAVILKEEAVGRSGPGEDYLQVFTLHEGTRVTVERAEGSWLLIRLSNGVGGWLPGGAMERI